MEFGEYLRKLRKDRGLSLREVGDRLSVTFNTLGRWERGQSEVDPDLLPELAEALDVDLQILKARHSDHLWERDSNMVGGFDVRAMEEINAYKKELAKRPEYVRKALDPSWDTARDSPSGPLVESTEGLENWRDWLSLVKGLTPEERMIALAMPTWRDAPRFVVVLDGDRIAEALGVEQTSILKTAQKLTEMGLAQTVNRRLDVLRLVLPEEFE